MKFQVEVSDTINDPSTFLTVAIRDALAGRGLAPHSGWTVNKVDSFVDTGLHDSLGDAEARLKSLNKRFEDCLTQRREAEARVKAALNLLDADLVYDAIRALGGLG